MNKKSKLVCITPSHLNKPKVTKKKQVCFLNTKKNKNDYLSMNFKV